MRRERRREGSEAAIRDLRIAIRESRRSGEPVPVGPLDDLAALLRATDGTASLNFAAVPLAGLLEEIAAATSEAGLVVSARGGDGAAWADREALRHVALNLVLEARASGARRVTLVCAQAGEHAQISVLHDGAPLPPPVAEAIGSTAGAAPATPPDGPRPSPRILAAIAIAEGMDAALRAISEPGPGLLLRIPGASAPTAAGPAPTPSTAAAPAPA